MPYLFFNRNKLRKRLVFSTKNLNFFFHMRRTLLVFSFSSLLFIFNFIYNILSFFQLACIILFLILICFYKHMGIFFFGIVISLKISEIEWRHLETGSLASWLKFRILNRCFNEAAVVFFCDNSWFTYRLIRYFINLWNFNDNKAI